MREPGLNISSSVPQMRRSGREHRNRNATCNNPTDQQEAQAADHLRLTRILGWSHLGLRHGGKEPRSSSSRGNTTPVRPRGLPDSVWVLLVLAHEIPDLVAPQVEREQ